jgi:hypothetical protein
MVPGTAISFFLIRERSPVRPSRPLWRVGFRDRPEIPGHIKGKAAVPLLDREATSRQAFSCFGIGYTLKISGKFDWNIDVGVVGISYKEKAMGITVKESAVGFRLDSGFSYHIGSRFFTDISASYIYGTSSVLDNPEVKLGGIGAGFGLGMKF